MPTRSRGGKNRPPMGPPIEVPCMALDQRALVEAMQLMVKTDNAESYDFPADKNFLRCLQRFVEVVPGARDMPTVDIDPREIPGISEQDVLTVNRDFLTLFRTAWAKEFPMVITAAIGDQFVAFSAHSSVWYEVLLRSTGPAMLEHWHSNEPLPLGICLCNSSADPEAPPVSLSTDDWADVVALWPQQYPDPRKLLPITRAPAPRLPSTDPDGVIIDDELPTMPPHIHPEVPRTESAPQVSTATNHLSDFEKLGQEADDCLTDPPMQFESPPPQPFYREPEHEQQRSYVQPGSEELPFPEIPKHEEAFVHEDEEMPPPPPQPVMPPPPVVYVKPPLEPRFVDVPSAPSVRSVPSGTTSIDPALHARVLQIEAMRIKQKMEEDNRKTQEIQELKIAALQSQLQSLEVSHKMLLEGQEKPQVQQPPVEEVKSPKTGKKKKKKKKPSMPVEEYNQYPRHASEGDFAFYGKMMSTRTDDAVWEPFQPQPQADLSRRYHTVTTASPCPLPAPKEPSEDSLEAYMYDDNETSSLPRHIVAPSGGSGVGNPRAMYGVLPLDDLRTNTPSNKLSDVPSEGQFFESVKQFADAACSAVNPTPQSSIRRSVVSVDGKELEIDPGLLKELSMESRVSSRPSAPPSTCDSLPVMLCMESYDGRKASVPIPPSLLQSLVTDSDGGEGFELPDEYHSPVNNRKQVVKNLQRSSQQMTRAIARPLPPLPDPPSEASSDVGDMGEIQYRHVSPPRRGGGGGGPPLQYATYNGSVPRMVTPVQTRGGEVAAFRQQQYAVQQQPTPPREVATAPPPDETDIWGPGTPGASSKPTTSIPAMSIPASTPKTPTSRPPLPQRGQLGSRQASSSRRGNHPWQAFTGVLEQAYT